MRTVAFLLLPGVHLMDLAGPAQVFYEAGQLGRFPVRIHYVGLKSEVTTAQRLQVMPTISQTDLKLGPDDFLCIPGTDFIRVERGELDGIIPDLRTWLLPLQERGVLIGSICSGALVLAKLGMLNGRACTTHWKCMTYLERAFPLVRLQRDRLYCFDRGIYTSAGMTSGIDMSLALVERWANPLLAAKVAKEMVINVRRLETSSQENTFLNFRNHFHPKVYQAQELLAHNLSTDYTVEELSRELLISSRQLGRLFKRHAGQTIHAFRSRLRLERAEQLLLHSEQSVNEIALECGFVQARQFIRFWKQAKGTTPGEWRKQKIGVGKD
ncbi:MAG: helix-turn-helix domain-containing protein [Bacteroidota bacterium]